MKLHTFFILLLLATSPLTLIEVTSAEEVEVIPNQAAELVIGATKGKLQIDPQSNQIRSINVSILLNVGQVPVYQGEDINSLTTVDVDQRGYYKIVLISATVGSVLVKSTGFPIGILIYYGILILLSLGSYFIIRRAEVFL